jgi:hypothetical protein
MLGILISLIIIILIICLAIFSFTTPNKQAKTKNKPKPTTNWEQQKKNSQQESQAEQKQEWFSKKRWLTDKEIDWVKERLVKNSKYKVLPTHQFHYVKETKGTAEANAHLAFPELLQELTSFAGDLVFIPVNNPDFHWSLLVYETKSQTFYHHDTLKGANYDYVQPLVSELLQQI